MASLLQHKALLAQKRIILASASERRSQLLRQIGVNFEVMRSNFEENIPKTSYAGNSAGYAIETAKQKVGLITFRLVI